MLRYNEDRPRHVAQDHAPGPKWYQVWATEGQAGAHALFLGAFYCPVRYMIEMVRPGHSSPEVSRCSAI